jgi:hypothetical protein
LVDLQRDLREAVATPPVAPRRQRIGAGEEGRLLVGLWKMQIDPHRAIRLARQRLELRGAIRAAAEDLLGKHSAATMVGEFKDVTQDHLHLHLLRLGQCLPGLEHRLDLVLPEVIPRDIEEFPSPAEELPEQRIGDLLQHLARIKWLSHRSFSLFTSSEQ